MRHRICSPLSIFLLLAACVLLAGATAMAGPLVFDQGPTNFTAGGTDYGWLATQGGTYYWSSDQATWMSGFVSNTHPTHTNPDGSPYDYGEPILFFWDPVAGKYQGFHKLQIDQLLTTPPVVPPATGGVTTSVPEDSAGDDGDDDRRRTGPTTEMTPEQREFLTRLEAWNRYGRLQEVRRTRYTMKDEWDDPGSGIGQGNLTHTSGKSGVKSRRVQGDLMGVRPRFSPPREGLRDTQYDVSATTLYAEERLRLPVGDLRTTARTRGVKLNGRITRDRLTARLSAFHHDVSNTGIFEAMDHEWIGAGALLQYRALSQSSAPVGLRLLGSAVFSRTRYEDEIPEVAQDTSYLTPGAGIAADRAFGSWGAVSAVYHYAATYALGDDRRQVTGRRDIRNHAAGLSWTLPVFVRARSTLWASCRSIYNYTPDLPDEYDNDAVEISGELAYRRDAWAVSASVDHVLEDDTVGRNWTARLSVYRNF